MLAQIGCVLCAASSAELQPATSLGEPWRVKAGDVFIDVNTGHAAGL